MERARWEIKVWLVNLIDLVDEAPYVIAVDSVATSY